MSPSSSLWYMSSSGWSEWTAPSIPAWGSDTPAPRGLREAGVAELVQEHARLGGDAHGVVEVRARLRVQVEAQLVRMVDVVAANRPRMKRDRAHLGRPGDDGHLRGTDLIRASTRRELDPRGLHVVRSSL